MQELEPVIFHGKVIGHIRSDHVFITRRTQEHYFVKYRGFGLSSSVIEHLKKREVRKIVLLYQRADGGEELHQTFPNKFYDLGHVWNNDGDYQRILPLEHWNMKVAQHV
jgi:hypothetical protein